MRTHMYVYREVSRDVQRPQINDASLRRPFSAFDFFATLSEASEAFPVDINRSLTVGHLKDAIKAKKPNDFAGIDANKLKLWKVEIPSDHKDLIQGQLVLDDELLVVDEIQEHWTI